MIDVLITSVLTSGIVATIVFWLLNNRYNKSSKKKIDEIMNKINNQSHSFTSQVDDLKKNLNKIMKALDIIKKKKS